MCGDLESRISLSGGIGVKYLERSVKLFREVLQMLVKQGVSIGGIQAELLFGMMMANDLFEALGETLVITSVTDGEHGRLSYHPMGFAFDCRLPVEVSGLSVAQRLRETLGDQWDVVLEQTHIHIEFEVRRVTRSLEERT